MWGHRGDLLLRYGCTDRMTNRLHRFSIHLREKCKQVPSVNAMRAGVKRCVYEALV